MLCHLSTICTLVFTLLVAVVPLRAEENEPQTLQLFSGEEEQIVTTSRIPRPVSRIAENVTVITAEQIALLNAHTLADVLNTIPGVQLDQVRTPGSWTDFSIQGASAAQSHVLVLVDGVQVNNFLQGMADPGLIPVQQIERIEIVKGSASTAWGPALGGVVNVITKTPESERPFSGTVSASVGERFTTDSRGEISGTTGSIGYYLTGGNLHSDGLRANNGINHNNGYGKLTYQLPSKGSLTFGASIRDSARGLEEEWVELFQTTVHDSHKSSFVYSFLSLIQPLSEQVTLDMMLRGSYRDDSTVWGHVEQGVPTPDLNSSLRESSRGGSVKLSWGDSETGVVSGIDYDHQETSNRSRDALTSDVLDQTDKVLDRLGIYSNGTFSFGPFTVLPGIRFDHTGIGRDVWSYTLGATYRLTDKTVLRAYGARGFSLPLASFNHGPQKVWTVQTGFETTDLPYLWLKGTLFYNNTWDSQGDVNEDILVKQTKQGFEVEARTIPWHGLSLGGGYTFIDARDRDTHERLQSVPSQIAKLALRYDAGRLGLSGILTGNYVWWNAPAEFESHYTAIIWDLHLTKKLFPLRELSPEIFFSAHNLFNGTQESIGILYKNAPRWLEGGVRFKF